jgi:hypothetical protein
VSFVTYSQHLTLAQKICTAMSSPFIQYLIGVLINLLYLVILITNQISYQNIQVPENTYSENLWKGTDVLTYVQPARNFVNYRVFGDKTLPDYHRTIGYPLFLSILMMVLGDHWLIFTLFVQAIIFALMYPLLSMISHILFNTSNRHIIFVFLFFIFSGTYIVMVPMILTDTFFTVFFTLGLWLGFESIIKRSYMYLLLHVILMGYAAQVRPLLSLYPVINCLILEAVALKYGLARCPRTYQTIIASFILLLIICNLPSIRNYMNYHFPKPTDVSAAGLLDCLGQEVLIVVGKEDKYKEIQNFLQEVKDPNVRTNLQEKLAIKIYKDYPLTTLKRMMHNAIGVLGRAHWPLVAHFWGYSFLDNFSPYHMNIKRSISVYLIEIFFNIVYLFILLLFLGSLVRISGQNIVFSLTIVLFIAYFLVPAFIVGSAGGRYRLPVEGLIVIMALYEFDHHFGGFDHRIGHFRPLTIMG